MVFPTEPTVPLPTWATDSGSVKVDPGSTKRAEGWTVAGPGLEYGEAPPFPWVNNEAFNNGEWAKYYQQALEFIRDGGMQPSYARISQNTGVSFSISAAGSYVPIFNTVTYQNTTDTPYNTSTGVFTAPKTGYFSFSCNLALTFIPASADSITVRIDDTSGAFALLASLSVPSSGSTNVVSSKIDLSLTAGQQINLIFFTNSFSASGSYGNSSSSVFSQNNTQILISWL